MNKFVFESEKLLNEVLVINPRVRVLDKITFLENVKKRKIQQNYKETNTNDKFYS